MDNFEWFRANPLIDESIYRRSVLKIFDEPISICNKIDEIKKGNDNIEKILEIYENNQLKKIEKEKAGKIEKIRNESKIGKIVSNLKKQADKELSKIVEDYDKNENIINIDFELDPITKKKTHKIVDEALNKVAKLKNKIEEVKALLNIAENYEQKIEILKNHEILDENGKIKN